MPQQSTSLDGMYPAVFSQLDFVLSGTMQVRDLGSKNNDRAPKIEPRFANPVYASRYNLAINSRQFDGADCEQGEEVKLTIYVARLYDHGRA